MNDEIDFDGYVDWLMNRRNNVREGNDLGEI